MKPQASIVIPTFNRASILGDTIESCLSQTLSCEVIVCDHGSTDNTPAVVAQFGERVQYVRREKDFGPHWCWLEGILHTTTDILHLQYDDDLIEPTFMERSLALLDEQVGFVFTATAVFHEDGQEEMQLHDVFPPGFVKAKLAEKFLLNNLVSPGCILLRKKDAIDALYQGELPLQKNTYHGVGPDLLLSLICLLRYPGIGYINEPLARFRAHEGSITMDAYQDKEKERRLKAAYAETKRYYLNMKLNKLLPTEKLARLLPL